MRVVRASRTGIVDAKSRWHLAIASVATLFTDTAETIGAWIRTRCNSAAGAGSIRAAITLIPAVNPAFLALNVLICDFANEVAAQLVCATVTVPDTFDASIIYAIGRFGRAVLLVSTLLALRSHTIRRRIFTSGVASTSTHAFYANIRVVIAGSTAALTLGLIIDALADRSAA